MKQSDGIEVLEIVAPFGGRCVATIKNNAAWRFESLHAAVVQLQVDSE
jgi:hypothetical protein